MVTSCCVVNCINKHTKDSKLPFYKIPSNKAPIGARSRREWLKAISRSDWDTWTQKEYQQSMYVVATSSQVGNNSFNSVLIKKINGVFEIR